MHNTLKNYNGYQKTIVHIITSLKIGGAESLLVDFVLHPEVSAFNHYVIYFYDGPHRIRLEEHGIPCFRVNGLLSIYDPILFIRLYRLIKKLKPQCIHTWLWSANVVGRIVGSCLKIPVLNSFHSEVNQDGKLRTLIDYYTQQLSQRIVAVSDGIAQSLVDTHKATMLPRITIIKNGIDAQKIAAMSKKLLKDRKELGFSEDQYIIGSVGRWVPCKNYSFLISLFAHVYAKNNTMRLLLLGKGELKAQLMKQAYELGLEDIVVFVEGQKAVGYYPLMDCFIQTTFKEGISLALLEAMSCSIPCIVIQNSYKHDVIRHEENGLLIPKHCLQSGALAIEQLFYNKHFAYALALCGFNTVMKEFDLDTMVKTYSQEYSQLITSNH